jgi:excisionase family DNA binding protein
VAGKGGGPKYHTTHQVAQLLGVSLPTVVNWVNGGLLSAHRTPGGHRRISTADLAAFAQENDYPLELDVGEAPAEGRRVLVVDDEPDFAEMVRDYLGLKGTLDVRVADDPFVAGVEMGRFQPHAVVLDLQLAGLDGLAMLARIRADPDLGDLPVIACSDFADAEKTALAAGFDAFLAKPLKLDDLLACVEGQLGD